ncbi:MAG TPA: hypothetical protein VHA55_09145 [Pseudorhodoplanes sp.]|jgi:hypothetical protein|nr:hypothetical protein [Pseudorhodoplanes sp.]
MIRVAFMLLIAAGAFAQTARAQSPEGEDARYSFHRVDEGFLRLDGRTGQVSLCTRKTAGFGCYTVPDERAALEAEIARLQNENSALKKELLSRGLSLPGAIKDDTQPEPPVAKRNLPELKLPSDADLERMRAAVEKVWRRFVEMIMNLRKDMLEKT